MKREKDRMQGHLKQEGFSGFQTGYVIELERGRYYAGKRSGRICCQPLWGARYYGTMEKAEQSVYRELGFAGIRVQICRVCYTLVEAETLEAEWRFYRENGHPVQFSRYQDAKNYQRENSLDADSVVEICAFQKKEIYLAA